MNEELDRRLCEDGRYSIEEGKGNLCAWRIDVGPWLEATEDWHGTPVAERSPEGRPLSPATIAAAIEKSGFRPILWAEGLEDLNPSGARLGWLNCLFEAVYQEGGIIMATTTWSKEELTKQLPYRTRRRLTGGGEGDCKSQFHAWDFYKAIAKDGKQGI